MKLAYVRLSEDGEKRTNLVHDWAQADVEEERAERKGKLLVGEVKKWDVETDITRSLIKNGVLETVSESDYKELKKAQANAEKTATAKGKKGEGSTATTEITESPKE